MQTVIFLGFFLVLILASESAVINRDGSGAGELPPDIPDLFGKDKNFRKVPPFGEPALAGEEFDIYGFGVNNPEARPLDYDYKNTVGDDYDARTDDSGKNPENLKVNEEVYHFRTPGIDRDDYPHEEEEDRDEYKDNEIPRKNDEEEKDNEIPKKHDQEDEEIEEPKKYDEDNEEDRKVDEEDVDHPVDEDLDEPFGAEEDAESDDEDIHKDIENPLDSGEEDADEPEDTGLFHGGFIFDTPFFNVRQMAKYFQQLEKAVAHVFRQTMDEALLLNGTYANTTEEEVEIDGKKYIVQKSIIKGKDNSSSIYIEALSSKLKANKTEEHKDSGL